MPVRFFVQLNKRVQKNGRKSDPSVCVFIKMFSVWNLDPCNAGISCSLSYCLCNCRSYVAVERRGDYVFGGKLVVLNEICESL